VLFFVCCVLCVVFCVLCFVCCFLCFVCCFLCVVFCVLFFVCCFLCVVFCVLFFVCCLSSSCVFVCPVLQVSLDWQFLIALSIVYNGYFKVFYGIVFKIRFRYYIFFFYIIRIYCWICSCPEITNNICCCTLSNKQPIINLDLL
jgi:hypothetical protein